MYDGVADKPPVSGAPCAITRKPTLGIGGALLLFASRDRRDYAALLEGNGPKLTIPIWPEFMGLRKLVRCGRTRGDQGENEGKGS